MFVAYISHIFCLWVCQMNVLFFSPKCTHCNEMIHLIERSGTSKMFNLANVTLQNVRARVPRDVTCVPTIYCASQKKYISDQDCFDFIAGLSKECQSNDDISPYNADTTLGFECLDGSCMPGGAYCHVASNVASPEVKQSVADTQLEKLVQARNMDMVKIFGSNPPIRS